MQNFVLINILVIFFSLSGSILNVEGSELDQCLLEIDRQRTGKGTEMERLETECLKLLRKHNSPEDKGRIYVAIAFMYANNEMRRPTKIVEYCKKSLQYPLEIEKACQIYTYLGEAFEVTYRDATGKQFGIARRQIIVPYLTGLKLVLDNQTTSEIQEAPAVGRYRYNGPPDNPLYKKMLKQRNEEIAARKKVMLQNELIRFHDIFMQKSVFLYLHKPYATDELKRIAREILKDHDAVKWLINKVKANINQ